MTRFETNILFLVALATAAGCSKDANSAPDGGPIHELGVDGAGDAPGPIDDAIGDGAAGDG